MDILTDQQLDELCDACRSCRSGIIPDHRRGFYNLAIYALLAVPPSFTSDLEMMVNNWDMFEFPDIFLELSELVNNHHRVFSQIIGHDDIEDDTESDSRSNTSDEDDID